MKTFFSTLLATSAVASSVTQFGNTGHFGNGFAHKGTKDHSPQDHTYGYDSVPVDFDISSADNDTVATSLKAKIIEANNERLNYIELVHAKRKQRLTEIHDDNMEKIDAPFDYQIRLIEEEENDVLQARNEALRDSNDAFSDLIFRLESFSDDIQAVFDDEMMQIGSAVQRAAIDHKNPCAVLLALRIDWLSIIQNCDASIRTVAAATAADTAPNALSVDAAYTQQDEIKNWGEYDTIFSDFHYDIGHGKGTGIGEVNSINVQEGFRNGNLQQGAMGDRQTQVGAPTHVWERPGSHNRRRF